MSKHQGAGSVWNVNSWHWESKNKGPIAKNIIQEKFLGLVLQPSKDLKIRHTNVKFLKNEAEINIRKGKQILVYDFDIELTVNGSFLNNSGQHESQDNSEGSYKVRQIINDNLDDIIVEDIKATQKNTVANQMKKWLKTNIKGHIVKLFQTFEEDLKKVESDPHKLQEDRKEREQLQKATQKARQQKGALKEKLLQQQRQRQKKAKQEAYRKTLQQKMAQSK